MNNRKKHLILILFTSFMVICGSMLFYIYSKTNTLGIYIYSILSCIAFGVLVLILLSGNYLDEKKSYKTKELLVMSFKVYCFFIYLPYKLVLNTLKYLSYSERIARTKRLWKETPLSLKASGSFYIKPFTFSLYCHTVYF